MLKIPKRRLRGYARVSAEDQVNDAKLIEMKAARPLKFPEFLM
jgi:hypothetical protein